MLTVRLHLDAVTDDNAPLLIARGSHRLGRIPTERIEETVSGLEVATCLAASKDVWVYRTPILHASAPSTSDKSRRVLQADYCASDLPHDLNWLGI